MNDALRNELLQHATLDPQLMRRSVALVEEAVRVGEAAPWHLGLLVDRIRVMEGRAQLYGTSHNWDENGNLAPLPIEDPANVDQRRQQLGLEPVAENTRRLRAQAAAEGERPPTNHADRRREMEAWAKSTGWR